MLFRDAKCFFLGRKKENKYVWSRVRNLFYRENGREMSQNVSRFQRGCLVSSMLLIPNTIFLCCFILIKLLGLVCEEN